MVGEILSVQVTDEALRGLDADLALLVGSIDRLASLSADDLDLKVIFRQLCAIRNYTVKLFMLIYHDKKLTLDRCKRSKILTLYKHSGNSSFLVRINSFNRNSSVLRVGNLKLGMSMIRLYNPGY